MRCSTSFAFDSTSKTRTGRAPGAFTFSSRGELPPSGKRTVVTSVHWRCERCGGARYVLVERGDERLSWCARCFDENVDRRATQEAPVTILDLEKHRETCTRCRPRSLCREGARILEAATQALAEIAAPMPSRKMGKA